MQLTAALQHLQQESAVRNANFVAQIKQMCTDNECCNERAASAHAEETALLREEAAAKLLQVSSARDIRMMDTPACNL